MFEEIVSSSEPLRKVLSQINKLAPSDSTVLILGQTGTGKELMGAPFTNVPSGQADPSSACFKLRSLRR